MRDKHPHQYKDSKCRAGAGPPQARHPGERTGQNWEGRQASFPSQCARNGTVRYKNYIRVLTLSWMVSFIPLDPMALAGPQHLPNHVLKFLYPPQRHPSDPLPQRTGLQGLWESDEIKAVQAPVSTSELHHTSYRMVSGFRQPSSETIVIPVPPLKLHLLAPTLIRLRHSPHLQPQSSFPSFPNLHSHSTNLEKPAQDRKQQQLVQEAHLAFTVLRQNQAPKR